MLIIIQERTPRELVLPLPAPPADAISPITVHQPTREIHLSRDDQGEPVQSGSGVSAQGSAAGSGSHPEEFQSNAEASPSSSSSKASCLCCSTIRELIANSHVRLFCGLYSLMYAAVVVSGISFPFFVDHVVRSREAKLQPFVVSCFGFISIPGWNWLCKNGVKKHRAYQAGLGCNLLGQTLVILLVREGDWVKYLCIQAFLGVSLGECMALVFRCS